MTEESISTSLTSSSDASDAGAATGDDPTGLADLIDIVERALNAAIDAPSVTGEGCPARLAEAMRYALLAPGKRLRPGLVLMAGEACGVNPLSTEAERLWPAAAAVEMIHAYSLIHDDLPAMDDDDLRRGRPTVHLKFDEATAILAGDALLTAAFSCLSGGFGTAQPKNFQKSVGPSENCNPALTAEAVATLATAAGATRLVGGQADDLDAESETSNLRQAIAGDADASLRQLESIHRRKTGALIAASLSLGAIFAEASERNRSILSDYAGDLGLAFQVVDDLLDFTAEASVLGKRAGKDAQRGKLTYPGLLGVDASRRRASELVDSAVANAALLGPGAWRLKKLARYVLERTH